MFGWLASLYVAAPVGDDDFLYLDEEEGGGGSVVVEEKSHFGPKISQHFVAKKKKTDKMLVSDNSFDVI